MFDNADIRRQFHLLHYPVNGHPLIYLDTAATAQKPQAVLDAMRNFYEHDNANAHRGMHVLAEQATVAYESARSGVQKFLNARRPEEIIFTKNATEGINLVARSWGAKNISKNDVIVLSLLEHHANIVPWLQLKEETGCRIEWMDIDADGQLQTAQLDTFLAEGNVKLVAITAQSNVLGVRPPLADIVRKAHAAGAVVLIDAAQHVAHHPTDVQALNADFLVFSGHKLYGPTGIGVLYGKEVLLDAMPPFLGGGSMIQDVHLDRFTPADIPAKFEAGTQPLAEAVGLAAAISWLEQYSWEDIEQHEKKLIQYAYRQLRTIDDLRIIGPSDAGNISGCISFTINGIHPHDLTEMLGRQGICLRAGHHCTQPLHRKLGLTATSRMSFGIYNNEKDIAQTASAMASICQSWNKP